LGPRELQQFIQLDSPTLLLLKHALTDLNLSARAYHRVLKVARTIADLAESENVMLEHVSEAIQYRSLDRQFWG
jgi:magnesium chelatase family protein